MTPALAVRRGGAADGYWDCLAAWALLPAPRWRIRRNDPSTIAADHQAAWRSDDGNAVLCRQHNEQPYPARASRQSQSGAGLDAADRACASYIERPWHVVPRWRGEPYSLVNDGLDCRVGFSRAANLAYRAWKVLKAGGFEGACIVLFRQGVRSANSAQMMLIKLLQIFPDHYRFALLFCVTASNQK